MLSAAAFADFDAPRLAVLRAQVQNMAVRQDRYRREALSLGVSPDNPETYRLIQCAERDAEALADLERLIALALRFTADENEARPTPGSPSAGSLMARALAAISGTPPARHCRALKRDADAGGHPLGVEGGR